MFKQLQLKTLLLLACMVMGAGSAWAQAELAILEGSGNYGTRTTKTDSHQVGWVQSTGQPGYLGANSAANHNKVIPTAADLPVVKAVKSDATTSTTGYYFYYTTTPLSDVGSIEFSYTANSGNSSATAYVVVGDAVAAANGEAYEVIELAQNSTTAQNASLGSSGTFTYTFKEPQTSARYYGFIIVTSSYKRMTNGKIRILQAEFPVTGVSLNKSETSIEAGSTETLTATIAPSNATNKNVTWTSSNEAVATVSSDGVVSALKPGNTTITVTTVDGGKTATCAVEVTASTSPIAAVSKASIDFGTIAINTPSVETFTVTPANLTEALTLSCDNSKYTISPTSIASDVTTETTITVTANPTAKGDDMDATITISGGGLAENKTVTLTATPYDPSEITLDFAFESMGSEGWTSSYAGHTVIFDNAKVVFASANKQTSTITDIPVTKGNDVELILTKQGETLRSVEFVCRQWTTKTHTITLHYSTNGGESYTSTGTTSTNFTISSNSLPAGTNAVKITFSGSDQVGIASATIGVNLPASHSAEVTSAGYATFCAPHALDFTSVVGLTAYTASVSGDVVTFNKVTGTVPAGTGLLLKGEGNYDIPVVASSTTDVSGNALVGKTAETVIGKKTGDKFNYVLKDGANGVGFYQVNNDSYKVRAGSAYLAVAFDASTGSAKTFIGLGEETSVNEELRIQHSELAPVYNLAGQRVDAGFHGIVIQNGKKVIR